MANQINQQFFGEIQGKTVSLFTLTSDSGLQVNITNYRGIITAIYVADNQQQQRNIVLGYNNLNAYQADQSTFFGAIVGRYANRISNGEFHLHDQKFTLEKNERNNTLHSGNIGMNQAIWDAKIIKHNGNLALTLQYVSIDGEQGFPGNLNCLVTYSLRGNHLLIDYHAICDKDTPINLTNHSYFNLAGQGNILDHLLQINANYFTPTNDEQLMTGEIISVQGTPFDFNSPRAIGQRINDEHYQLSIGKGYDHNFVLNKSTSSTLSLAANVFCPSSGISLQLHTTQPGLQFYSGNFLSADDTHGYPIYGGLALETQHFPDSLNHSHFPSTLLFANEEYRQRTEYRFYTGENSSIK